MTASGHLGGRIQSSVSRGTSDVSWERCQWVREETQRTEENGVEGELTFLSVGVWGT